MDTSPSGPAGTLARRPVEMEPMIEFESVSMFYMFLKGRTVMDQRLKVRSALLESVQVCLMFVVSSFNPICC